jgi:hypothetical protein
MRERLPLGQGDPPDEVRFFRTTGCNNSVTVRVAAAAPERNAPGGEIRRIFKSTNVRGTEIW